MTEHKTIVIVDDEEDLVRLISKRIRSLGYEPVFHLEGKGVVEAVVALQPRLPCLILLDIWLPDISGIDIFKMLKEHPVTQKIPVVFFSADPTKERYCLEELKAEGFIKKPYNPLALVEIIKNTAV